MRFLSQGSLVTPCYFERTIIVTVAFITRLFFPPLYTPTFLTSPSQHPFRPSSYILFPTDPIKGHYLYRLLQLLPMHRLKH